MRRGHFPKAPCPKLLSRVQESWPWCRDRGSASLDTYFRASGLVSHRKPLTGTPGWSHPRCSPRSAPAAPGTVCQVFLPRGCLAAGWSLQPGGPRCSLGSAQCLVVQKGSSPLCLSLPTSELIELTGCQGESTRPARMQPHEYKPGICIQDAGLSQGCWKIAYVWG